MVHGKKVKFFEGFVFDSWLQAIVTVVGMVAVVVIVLWSLAALLISNGKALYAYEDTVGYVVEQGDTLWTIARRYTTEQQDVRRAIDIIEEVNECDANLHPGQWLEIPVFNVTLGD